jgi:hypothetical protein
VVVYVERREVVESCGELSVIVLECVAVDCLCVDVLDVLDLMRREKSSTGFMVLAL